MEIKHYNHFTIRYIEALLKNLDIRVFDNSVYFFPDTTKLTDFDSLKLDLDEIWKDSQSAITLLELKEGALIQNALFGLVDDFELALKTGYLLGDRIVVVDYIYERILNKRSINNSEILRVGDLCKNLVLALDLAKSGKFVIIPSPLSWSKKTKKLLKKLSKTTILTAQSMSLLNILSISNKCNLHPYTIAESNDEYMRILNKDSEVLNQDNLNESNHLYRKLLVGLLSERILTNAEFEINNNIPLNQYISIIESEEDFYKDYLQRLSQGGRQNADYNIKNINEDIKKSLKSKKKIGAINALKKVGKVSTTAGASITLIGGIVTLNPGLMSIGVLMGLVSPFTDWFNEESLNETATISVFQKLKK